MERVADDALAFVKDVFCEDCSGHDYFHTLRVYRMAVKLAEREQADLSIVRLAAGARRAGGQDKNDMRDHRGGVVQGERFRYAGDGGGEVRAGRGSAGRAGGHRDRQDVRVWGKPRPRHV